MLTNPAYLQVFEHQVLRIDKLLFRQEHLDILSQYQEQAGQKYFSLVHQGVKFKQYVGVLQVGNLTIEILPKTDQYDSPQYWQQFLLDLLHQCQVLPTATQTIAPLQLENGSLLHWYIDILVQSVEQIFRQGLQKSYQQIAQNSPTWKGRINFAKQIKQQAQLSTKVATISQQYRYQSTSHQVILAALKIIAPWANKASLQHRIQYLIQQFPKQYKGYISEALLEQLPDYSLTHSYYFPLQLSKMIIRQHRPSLRAGQFALLALLFDMNQLFEQWIGQQLTQHLPTGCQIHFQHSRAFWQQKKLRPDIWIQKGKQNYILDTKWKVLKKPQPSDEDLRQIYAYNHNFEATKSLLIYPDVFGWGKQQAGTFAAPLWVAGQAQPHQCELVFLPIVDQKGQLSTQIANTIWQALALQ